MSLIASLSTSTQVHYTDWYGTRSLGRMGLLAHATATLIKPPWPANKLQGREVGQDWARSLLIFMSTFFWVPRLARKLALWWESGQDGVACSFSFHEHVSFVVPRLARKLALWLEVGQNGTAYSFL